MKSYSSSFPIGIGMAWVLLLYIVFPVPVQAGMSQQPELPRTYVDTVLPASASICTVTIPSGGNLQTAIDSAKLGDTICLQPGVTYRGEFVLKNKTMGSGWITIRTATPDSQFVPAGTRVNPSNAPAMAKLEAPSVAPVITTEMSAHHYRLIGLEITVSTASVGNYNLVYLEHPNQKSVEEMPAYIVIDRCYIHGNPTGQFTRRGVTFNGRQLAVVDSYISEIHDISDAQAIGGWNGAGPFKIQNNYLEATGENIMFGGDTPSIAGLVARDIEIRGNYLYKPLKWKVSDPAYAGVDWSIKNLFELKAAQRLLLEGNVLENSWLDSQVGWGVIIHGGFSSDGVGASSTDLTLRKNIIKNVENGLVLATQDSTSRLTRVLVQDNLILNDSGHLFQVANGWDAMQDIAFDHNTAFNGRHTLVFDGYPTANVSLTNNIANHNDYGIFGSGYGSGNGAINYFAPPISTVPNRFTKNVLISSADRSREYPNGNFFPSSLADVKFANVAGGDYRLADSSPYNNLGTDGRDIGANIEELEAATARAITGNGTVTPPPPTDTTPPAVTLTAPAAGSTLSGAVAVAASASDNVSVSGVQFKLDGANLGAEDMAAPYSVSWNTASATNGSHTLTAVARDSAGNTALAASVAVVVSNPVAQVTCPAAGNGTFSACYYDGMSLASPVATGTVSQINFDWGLGAPHNVLDPDTFSARYQGVFPFESGIYQFTATADDGVRVYVDNALIIDQWKDQPASTYSATTTVVAGNHTVKVEYYENAVNASLKLHWTKQAGGTDNPDTTAPVLSAIASSLITPTSAAVTWTTNEPSDTQVEYGTSAGLGSVTPLVDTGSGLKTAHAVTLTGLSPASTYYFRVKSKDAAGNPSVSAAYTFTTPALPTTGGGTGTTDTTAPVISSVYGKASKKLVVISWQTNEPADTQVEYGHSASYGQATPLNPLLTLSHSVTIKGLQQNQTYHFRVKSKDQAGNLSVSGDYLLSTRNGSTATPSGTQPGDVVKFAGSPTVYLVEEDGLYAFPDQASLASYQQRSGEVVAESADVLDGLDSSVAEEVTAADVLNLDISTTPATGGRSPRLVKAGSTYYLITNGQKQGITSPGLLFSHGFDWQDATDASDTEAALPDGPLLLPGDGSLVKGTADPTVYLISGQQRYAFTSASVFRSQGYKFSSVLTVTDPELQALPLASELLSDGTAAHLPGSQVSSQGTVYWVGGQFLHPYPSLAVYNSWNKDNDFSFVVPANAQDVAKGIGEAATSRW